MDLPLKITFLIVDDIDSIRATLAKNLLSLGMKGPIYPAPHVKEAKQILSTQKVDFIISDWNMPVESGLSFLKYVRKEEPYKNLPFIMLTTENEVTKVMEAIEEGASNYLIKPWTVEDLSQKIITSWQKHHK